MIERGITTETRPVIRLNTATEAPAPMAVALFALLAFRTALCAGEPAEPGNTVSRSLQHADLDRTYRLHLPRDFRAGAPVPLVIAIHGLGMNGEGMELFTDFSPVADEHGFAVVYPDGLNRMWRFWERPELGDQVKDEPGYVDDVGYIAALIDSLVAEGLVNPRRVYATGLSNGGYMSNRLACLLPDKIAAIAPVAGTTTPGLIETKPSRPIPVLYIHGTRDHIVGYDGTDQFTREKSSLSAQELVQWWAEQNGCGPVREEKLADAASDNCTVIRHVHPQAEGPHGAPVIFYEVKGGGHTWPDGKRQPVAVMGTVCRDFNASEVMWEFFSQFELADGADTVTPIQ
jgi:polyhydroxybutyrate depolymerase